LQRVRDNSGVTTRDLSAAPAVLARLLPTECLLFSGDVVCLGTFACEVADASFAGGEPSTSHCVVFSRTPVWIQHDGGARYVADATRLTLHNRGRAYRRWRIDDRGDRCNWLAFSEAAIAAVVGRWDPAHIDRAAAAPFRFQHAPAAPALYLRQRGLFERLQPQMIDRLAVEEESLAILHDVAARIYEGDAARMPRLLRDRRRECDAVYEVRSRIAAAPAAAHALRPLAAAVELSAYQLCRAFTRICGETLTAYRSRLRILGSLDAVCAGEDLTTIALAWGFASHSHFTWAFRQILGVTPSAVRAGTAKIRRKRNPR
jgi:AraC family transcriptional regulator